jgi:hypothetical protein
VSEWWRTCPECNLSKANCRCAGDAADAAAWEELYDQKQRLADLCRALIDHLWGSWPEDARASLRRSNPEHAVVVMERELAEITGGTP